MASASGVAVYSQDGHWLAVVQSDHVALWNTRTRLLHGRIVCYHGV